MDLAPRKTQKKFLKKLYEDHLHNEGGNYHVCSHYFLNAHFFIYKFFLGIAQIPHFSISL